MASEKTLRKLVHFLLFILPHFTFHYIISLKSFNLKKKKKKPKPTDSFFATRLTAVEFLYTNAALQTLTKFLIRTAGLYIRGNIQNPILSSFPIVDWTCDSITFTALN